MEDQNKPPYTEQEQKIMDHLTGAWNEFNSMVQTHPDDVHIFRKSIHELQSVIGMRILRRDYPNEFVSVTDKIGVPNELKEEIDKDGNLLELANAILVKKDSSISILDVACVNRVAITNLGRRSNNSLTLNNGDEIVLSYTEYEIIRDALDVVSKY